MTTPRTSEPRPRAHSRLYVLLLVLFGVEAALFYWTIAHNVAPYYPINNDQISYYLYTYRLINDGWLAVLHEFTNGVHATGMGFTAAGAALGLVFGPNRTAIVSFNLICLLALELVQFRVLLARTQNAAVAWISIALLMSAQSLFNGAGGLYDFRIDFAALCLYGIWVYSILWCDVFANTRRSGLVVLATALLVAFRYLTTIYVAVLLGALLVVFVVGLFRHGGNDERRALLWRRTRNLVWVGLVSALLIGPLLFASRQEIYNYYVVGHVVGEEKYIRAHMLGLFTLADHLLYYPRSLYRDHLGWITVALMAAAGLVSSALPPPSLDLLSKRLRVYALDVLVLGLAVVIPLAVLTADISKSSVVGGIVIAPLVALVCLWCTATWRDRDPAFSGRNSAIGLHSLARRIPAIRLLGAVCIVAIGVGCFTERALRSPIDQSASDLRNITEINEIIDRYMIQTARPVPTISFDRVMDYLNWGTVVLFGFEQHHQMINLSPQFGHSIYGIFAVPRDVAFKLFGESDVIVLTDPVRGRTGYPTDKKIVEYWSDLEAWTKAHRTLIYSTVIYGVPHAVYVRPPVPAPGTK